MRKIIVGFGVLLAAVRCEGTHPGNPAGTNTGNPVEPSFTASDCRVGQQPPSDGNPRASTDSGASLGTSTSALSSNADGGADNTKRSAPLDSNEDDFFRLNCVAWELKGDSTLQVNLWNMQGGCSAHWAGGSARFEGQALHLDAYEQGCEVARCGACIYDFHFEVRDVPRNGDVPLFFDYTDEHEKSCGQPDNTHAVFTLPTTTEPSGVRCSPIYTVGLEKPPVCVRHGACGDNIQLPPFDPPESCPTCPNGDVCGPIVEGGGNECLQACVTDADCENAAMGCVNGGCTIVSTWCYPGDTAPYCATTK